MHTEVDKTVSTNDSLTLNVANQQTTGDLCNKLQTPAVNEQKVPENNGRIVAKKAPVKKEKSARNITPSEEEIGSIKRSDSTPVPSLIDSVKGINSKQRKRTTKVQHSEKNSGSAVPQTNEPKLVIQKEAKAKSLSTIVPKTSPIKKRGIDKSLKRGASCLQAEAGVSGKPSMTKERSNIKKDVVMKKRLKKSPESISAKKSLKSLQSCSELQCDRVKSVRAQFDKVKSVPVQFDRVKSVPVQGKCPVDFNSRDLANSHAMKVIPPSNNVIRYVAKREQDQVKPSSIVPFSSSYTFNASKPCNMFPLKTQPALFSDSHSSVTVFGTVPSTNTKRIKPASPTISDPYEHEQHIYYDDDPTFSPFRSVQRSIPRSIKTYSSEFRHRGAATPKISTTTSADQQRRAIDNLWTSIIDQDAAASQSVMKQRYFMIFVFLRFVNRWK